MRVELVRAWAGRFEAAVVHVPAGAVVADALAAAGWALDTEFVALAVFGQTAGPQTPLEEGDRIELLRPLQCDPMQARRRRAGARTRR
ncbi:RnfH family protein [Thermomonas sp. S9]|uniref:RnfH family protein n=1 Tax=Thermomonas sp. S9 TaxID=2885203 RepID=UPI00216AD720|nr:RnfH family protein [Thermomonas sp. S9]MCR6496248.1 RnfH family protein [Thermomonas sp. S9]